MTNQAIATPHTARPNRLRLALAMLLLLAFICSPNGWSGRAFAQTAALPTVDDVVALIDEAATQLAADDVDAALVTLAAAADAAVELDDAALHAEVQSKIGDVQNSAEAYAAAGDAYLLAGQEWDEAEDAGSALTAFVRAAASFEEADAREEAIAAYGQAAEVALAEEDAGTAASMIQRQGDLARDGADYPAAVDFYTAALELLSPSDLADQAEITQNLGALYVQMGDPTEAAATLLVAAELWTELNAPQYAQQASLQAAGAYEQAEEYAQARSLYEELLAVTDAEGNPEQAAELLTALGRVARGEGDFAASTEAFSAAIAIWQEQEAPAKAAQALAYVGLNYADDGDVESALDYYEQAVESAQAADDEGYAAAVQMAAADLLFANDESEAASVAYSAALDLARAANDPVREVEILAKLAAQARDAGDYAASTEAYTAAVELWQTNDNPRAAAEGLAYIGLNYADQGESATALDYYAESIALADEAGDPGYAVAVAAAGGDLLRDSDDAEGALDFYSQALDYARQADDPARTIDALVDVAQTQLALTAYEESIATYEEAITLWEAADDLAGKAQGLAYIGLNYEAMGQPARALEYYTDAVAAAEEADDLDYAVAVLLEAGRLQSEQGGGNPLALYQEARTLAQEAGNATREAEVLAKIGQAARDSGNFAASSAAYTDAIAIWRTQDKGDQIAQGLAMIGQNYASQNNPEEALAAYDQAVDAALSAGDTGYAATLQDGIAQYLTQLTRVDDALVAYETAATRWQQAGDGGKAVLSLLSAAQIATNAENYAAAADLADQAIKLADAGRDAEARVKSRLAYGDAFWLRGQQDVGWEQYNQALEIARQGRDSTAVALALDKLASAHFSLRHFDEAIALYGELLAEPSTTNDLELATYVRKRMWQSYVATRQFAAAEEVAGRPNGIDLPRNGATVSGTIAVEGLAQGADFDKWQLDLLLDGAEENATFVDWSGKLPWWTTGRVWGELTQLDTTLYPNGEHKLRLRIVRPGGNYDEFFTDIRISN